MPTCSEREAQVLERLAALGSVLIAHSGGVDSTYLGALAVEALGDGAVAATAVSPSLPESERSAAAASARSLGLRHVEVRTAEMEKAAYRRNDADRCYFCKTSLFDVLTPLAGDLGVAAIAVGTIADDLGDHRPGLRAAAERGVLTPLADAGMAKADVRERARARGLAVWDKPAAACLASRVVHGLEVTPSRLARIEQAEAALRATLEGPVNLRVRDHGEIARVEVDRHAFPRLVERADELAALLRGLGWRYACFDLEGFRSGSMNPEPRLETGTANSGNR